MELANGGELFIYPFGAIVFHDLPPEQREAELARLRSVRPGLTTKVVRESFTVREEPEARVDIVAEMCRRGYASSMVLSQDASCHIDWGDPAMLALLPNWNYLHVERDVLPALRERGVAEADLNAMLIDNPRRWFEGL